MPRTRTKKRRETRIPLSRRSVELITRPPRMRAAEWIAEHGRNKRGDPFSFFDYPWATGICDAWDDPQYDRVFMMAGSRLGKTELAMQLGVFEIATNPDFGMIVGPTKEKVREWIKDRLYPLFERNSQTRRLVIPESQRNALEVRLSHSTIYSAWSGSPTTLGDRDPRVLLLFEINKFSKRNSEEADPVELALQRGSEIPDRHVFGESTGTIKGFSRIGSYVRNGTNCRFHCPCPRCGRYQWLFRGDPKKPKDGGLIWDIDSDGQTTPAIAYATARYRCPHCKREIPDEDRRPMVQRGVWCPAGATIDRRGRQRGHGYVRGPDWTCQLSRLYGPTFTFGAFARNYVSALGDDEKMQSHYNDWEGRDWSPGRVRHSWEEVAEPLCDENQATGECATGVYFLTCGVDVQIDHWVCWTTGWGQNGAGWVVAYGITHSWDETRDWIRRRYSHADGGPPLQAMISCVDARDGNRTDEVRDFCRSINLDSGPWVCPSMGVGSQEMGGRPYRKVVVDANRRKKSTKEKKGLVGFFELQINTNVYQVWIQNCLDRRNTSGLRFPHDAREDQDLWQQLLSEQPEWKRNSHGNLVCQWVRQDLLIPNDLRDACRYSRCAAEVYVNLNWTRIPAQRALTTAKTIPTSAPAVRRAPTPPSPQQPAGRRGGFIRKPAARRF